MIALLEELLSVFEDVGTYILAGSVDAVNLFFSAIGLFVTGLFSLLPAMSDAPSIGSPEWLGWANWFYPIGSIVAIFTTVLALYIAYLVVRWALRLARAA